jgi:DNA-binding LacI/PurR family transcriptional regulator
VHLPDSAAAFGAARAALDRGLRIPEDLTLFRFANIFAKAA